MELRVLHYFLAVVREENISKAAELLHVTQPTLSRQIAQLEEELGATLFVRGRHLQLTDAGLMLKRRAEEVEVLYNGPVNSDQY
ncbi:LysR family transcriptional regulator [uncultured Megasphaera sp.]|uniref:LysR family transcriptional regulator n=1 Tax=uncultured Megasphaera sp. TaxID=165188 RepID=UPI00259417E2|nr:LysR family transcriptional regulator [uncultured Megasphaera sp.]